MALHDGGAIRGRHAALMLAESANETQPHAVEELHKNPLIRLFVGG